MDDLKSVTVSHLRELAQKHLGGGYSKLKKEELIAALAAHIPALAKLARLAGITVARKSSTDKKVAAKEPRTERPKPAASKSPGRSAASSKVREEKPREPKAAKPAAREPKKALKAKVSSKAEPAQQEEKQGRVSAPKRVAAKRASEKPGAAPPARPAQVVTFPPRPRGPRAPEDSAASSSVASAAEEAGNSAGSASASAPAPETPVAAQPAAPPPPPVQHDAEPVVEGFFVARVMGEDEARRHHMVEASRRPTTPEGAPEYDEGLGGLPGEYQDDSTLLLPRDPHTLFVSWDFSAAARTRALQGLDAPRAVLRVFDGEKMVRELDCVLETRGHYIHDLSPGRPYRVEAHFVGRDGRNRRIGPSSNRVALPPSGTSTDTSIRFLRVPTRAPEPQPLPEVVPPVRARTPEFEEREYLTWRRVNLPGSAGVQDIPESRRERTGASERPDAHLEGPPRAPGASDQRYMEARERAPGASDMRYLESAERAPGASEQRYLEAPERAPGASEQRYLGSEQSRERQYLDVGRAPGASDMRYQQGASQPAGGARSAHQYLDVGRAPGASDMRYLDSPGRAPGASDMRYLESPPRAPGASDQRYLEYVARPPGASDSRDVEAAPGPQGSSEAPLPRKPPSGSDRS